MSASLEQEYIFQEIYEQPGIVRRQLAGAGEVWPATGGRTLITGAGDSHAASELLEYLLPTRRIAAHAAMSGSRAAAGLRPGDALIGISVSGRTVRVIEAAMRARTAGATVVAVTDDPGSPLTAEADRTWVMGASPREAVQTSSYTTPEAQSYVGYHHDVAQTKTCLAAITAVARAAGGGSDAVAGGDDATAGGIDDAAWERLPGVLDNLIRPAFYAPLQPRAEEWAASRQAFFLGSGPSLPLARFGCYKLFEFNRTAHCTDIEEYCHTHYFVTRPGDAVVFIAHDEDTAARSTEIAPVLQELFQAKLVLIHPADVLCPAGFTGTVIPVPTGPSRLERLLALLVATQWVTYLWGRIGAPDINTFHAGYDTERLVGASGRTIRATRIRPAPER